ncbi:hypothetical protein [Deinococcus metallilatus]|uniref:Transporter n=2 Tax=Deinococcus metallilatus TaxID=1211322 RepID=A0ABR6MX00_9DEIO|nr:hypothetical protein [Deinococcus metallilatus]MBB5296462.1 hypothetical protein [Deinococcus metallilatus]GMA17379.1 hypothetical protein GCM10025871_37100 [Deinococcus metallilatus]
MKRMMTALALAGACAGGAGALALDFGVTYRAGAPWDGGLLRAGVHDVTFGRGTLSAGVSNRAVEVGVVQGFSLPPAGALSARADAALTWSGGVRLSSRANGTLGPVALDLGGTFFTAPAVNVDPLAAWTLAPTDLRTGGWNADFTARYRVNRTLIAVLGGEFGPQNQGLLGVEWRRDLTRVLPPAEGDDPDAEPATERTGTLALRLGARAGQDVRGVTGGVTYSAESGFTVALDALAGPGTWGAVGSLSAPDVLGEGSTTRLYLAYEPWRRASAPLRAGAEATLPVGRGTLSLDVRGGTGGLGARVGYSFPLGGTSPEQP